MIAPGRRPLKVRFILPALKEATDPNWRPVKYSLFPPLGLATLAAYLNPDDQAIITDEHVEPLRLNDDPDLVVVQAYITNAYRAYRIADHYRRKGIFVCLGGLHVTALPHEAAPHADAIFLGPGEQTFPAFLNDFRAGQPKRVYASTTDRTLERIPPIRRDLIKRSHYLVPNSIVVTRGCPQHCDFGWRKFEPVWDLLIRARQLAHVTPLLEAVLSRVSRSRAETSSLPATECWRFQRAANSC